MELIYFINFWYYIRNFIFGNRRYFNFITLVYKIQSFINILLSLDFLCSNFELYILLNT
jgi:hypothetical protein